MIFIKDINTINDCINKFVCGNSIDVLQKFDDNSIDLIVTSPPYDDLRDYGNKDVWNFDTFKAISQQLYLKLKDGGVICWVVGDSVKNGSETLTSFKQAIYFNDIGFKIHDTMIYYKNNFSFPSKNRYHQRFEYIFILVKGKIKTFNPICDVKNKYCGQSRWGKNSKRQKNGELKYSENKPSIINEFGMRGNVWYVITSNIKSQKNQKAFQHPAVFPESLAKDLIISYSNEGDVVCDIFGGSGTVSRMCKNTNRNHIYIDIYDEYVKLAEELYN